MAGSPVVTVASGKRELADAPVACPVAQPEGSLGIGGVGHVAEEQQVRRGELQAATGPALAARLDRRWD